MNDACSNLFPLAPFPRWQAGSDFGGSVICLTSNGGYAAHIPIQKLFSIVIFLVNVLWL